MRTTDAPFAVITGVSRRTGFALAEHCAGAGFDLMITAADDGVDEAAARLRAHGGLVEPVRADLGDPDGVDELCDIIQVLGRPVDALITAPSRSRAGALRAGAPASGATSFFDQPASAVADGFDAAVLGPVRLAHRIGAGMRRRGHGRILLAGASPAAGASAAMLGGANAFFAGFSLALRQELAGDGVSVTYLPVPAACGWRAGSDGAERAPEAWARGMARLGFDAMMRGEAGIAPAAAAAILSVAGFPAGAPERSELAKAGNLKAS